MRKSIRPAIFIVAIFEPRCYWVLHELAILIELVVGVPLFLRITTTRIAVIVPQNPERALLLAQEPRTMQVIIHIVGCCIGHLTHISLSHRVLSHLVKSQLHQEAERFQLVDCRHHWLHTLIQALRR